MSASRMLGINQPSMSKRLALLQHAGRILQAPWLERRGKRWFLTEEGRRVLPAVEEILYRYRVLTEAIKGEGNRLHLAAAGGAVAVLIRGALRTWRQQFPEETLRLVTPGSTRAIEGVGNGSYDLAVVTEGSDEIIQTAHRPLAVQALLPDPLVLVAHPNWAQYREFTELAEKRLTARQITRFHLLLLDADHRLRQSLENRFREEGIRDRLNVAMELSEPRDLLGMCREGHGLAIVPRLAVRTLENREQLFVAPMPTALAPEHEWKVICRVRPGSEEYDLSPAGKAFHALLTQQAVELADP